MLAIDQILRLPLLPLLLLQGIAVRRRALILPEPSGPRQGQCGSGPLLRLLIAGDSSAAGVGTSDQAQALSGQMAAQLATNFELHWQLQATTGHKTRDTLAQLAALPKQRFDVVVLALGVNDVTSGTSRRGFAREQSQLMQLLEDRFEPDLILASGVPQMQLFPALPQPLAWVLGRQSTRLDTVLKAEAQNRPNVLHLPFELPQDPDLAAKDGYHPSAQAYHLWAELLVQHIHAQLKT
ncbi:SGNH/GDSL hydrolase family protein [Pseudophaeobacter sp.]|uniref:SGNH/GDSL hydrolase family protein n=1 Tax=Pseudophaeobacter sp. TaxID=1971739 RepID=UPI0032974918